MAEIKKLIDKELDRINGGASVSYDRLDVGDVFMKTENKYFVVSRTLYGPFNNDSKVFIRIYLMRNNKLEPMDSKEDQIHYPTLAELPYLPLMSNPSIITDYFK